MMRTANPALNAKTFENLAPVESRTMTLQGTVNKTGLLLMILAISTLFTWDTANPGSQMGWMLVGLIGGFVLAMITIFKQNLAPLTAPLYAAFEGLLLGGISSMFEARYPGIVFQAVTLTFGILAALLLAYTSRLIKPTENFKLGIVAATGGIALFYFVAIILGFFGVGVPLIHSSGPLGIAFSVVVVIIAALNLVLDFDFIEQGTEQGAPKFMEWYGAFGLIVTLVWLYLEILRLLAKLNRR
jgi:uncharacterized YccA/Bax inhibitor family protein